MSASASGYPERKGVVIKESTGRSKESISIKVVEINKDNNPSLSTKELKGDNRQF